MRHDAGAAARSINMQRWLWVPAFAGTTRGDRRRYAVRESNRKINQRRPGQAQRDPGSITSEVDVARRWGGSSVHKRATVIMGPRVRRDDERGAAPLARESRLSSPAKAGDPVFQRRQ